MRTTMRIFVVLLICAAPFLAGCGPTATEPKAVNVKEDPRIKRSEEGKKQKTEGALPGN